MATITTGTNIGSINLSTVTNTAEIGETWTINESAIMYMRPKCVTFTAQGLKPNTKYYPFFNGVDVSKLCSTQDGAFVSDIVTDNIGSVIGNFYLPAATFICGSHTFSLVDSVKTIVNDNNVSIYLPDPQYGSTSAVYEASGILKQQQKQITTLTILDTPPATGSSGGGGGGTLPITPPVMPPPVVTPPIIIYPPVQIPEPILPPFRPNPLIHTPPSPSGLGCAEWYYDYTITSNSVKPNYTVPSASATPPDISTISTAGSGIIEKNAKATITYVKTDKISDNKWNHVYSLNVPVTNKFRRTFYWAHTTIPPTIAEIDINKKPSGILSTDTYKPLIPKGSSTPWIFNKLLAGCTVGAGGEAKRVDPLAQSFFIDPSVYPMGVFITSVVVYFKHVDQSVPVILELRDMNNGLPGSNVLPGGKVVLPGNSVSQSDNASIGTVFGLDQPVYLSPATDFCFVLKSTSLSYDVWCSRFGDIDIVSGKVIDEQPFNGVLFKSSNDSTWTPNQYEDIKFDINIAEFNTDDPSIVSLVPQYFMLGDRKLYYNTKQVLPLSFIHTTVGSSLVKIYLPMHGLINSDKVFIGDFPGVSTPSVTAYNGIPYSNFKNGEFTATIIDEDYITIDVGANATLTGNIFIGDTNQLIDATPIDNNFTRSYEEAIPFNNEDNKSLNIAPVGAVLSIPTSPISITAASFEIYTNIIVNELMIDYLGTELPSTNITESITLTQASANGGNQYESQTTAEIDNNNKFYVFESSQLIVSGDNEQFMDTADKPNNSLVTLELKSNDKTISPTIELNGMSLIVKTNKIDNQNGEIDDIFTTYPNELATYLNDSDLNTEINSGTGIANAKYKSKVVQIKSESEAKRLSIFITGNCPSPAAIDVYVRLSTDESTHRDNEWRWVPLANPKLDTMDYTKRFINSINNSVINEWYYEYISTTVFSVFDIKLVMRTTNNSIIPKIYGIRTINNKV